MKLQKNSPRAGSSMVSHKKKRWNKVSFFMFVCLCTQYYRFLRFDASMLVTREYLLARLVDLESYIIYAFIFRCVGLFQIHFNISSKFSSVFPPLYSMVASLYFQTFRKSLNIYCCWLSTKFKSMHDEYVWVIHTKEKNLFMTWNIDHH